MSSILKDIKNLFVGLITTAKHLPRKEVTIQYPDEKWPMPERSRGIVVLLSDKETGELNCTTCLLCERACPSAAIKIDYEKIEKKRKLKEFIVDNSLCCFCGLCEEACNFAAIKMAGKYEFATWDKTDLIWNTAKLQEMGLDVPYEPKKKRKPKPKPTAKPAPPVDETKTEKPAEPKAEVIEEKPAEQAPPTDSKPDADIKPDDVETKNDESKDEQGDK
ncbi:MAG: NADH-quinone oxidoreductase subunit I [candidate division Zixibacteria bacterium]|nr:NADH-quinone oxidoreductase subunit I [candidate division Zixibacteria bacterium]